HADSVLATYRVQRGDERRRLEPLAVHGNRRTLLEADDHRFRLIRRGERRRRELQEIVRRRGVRVLEDTPLVGEVPEVGVARVDLLLGRGDRNAARGRIGDRVLTAPDVPLAPRRDDGEVWSERGVGQLEADLIIALASATVREGVGANGEGDLDLTARDEGARHGRAQEVFAVVDGAGAERRKNEVADKLLAEVLDVAFGGAGGERFGANAV